MELKDRIKRKIDSIPEEDLPQLEQYLEIMKKRKKRQIKTLHLKGKFDKLHIRKIAYE